MGIYRTTGLNMKNNKGISFIIVLGVIAILSGLAMDMIKVQSLTYYKSLNGIAKTQNKWAVYSNNDFINELLARHRTSNYKDSISDFWYRKPLNFKITDNVYTATHLTDTGDCMNINALARGEASPQEYTMAYNQFLTLMESLQIENRTAKQSLEIISDWLDRDDIGKYETQYGLTLEIARKPKNKSLESISELYGIGIDDEIIDKITPYSCPWKNIYINKLNINTVSNPILLHAFTMGNVSLEKAKSVIKDRPKDGFSTTAEAYQALNLKQDLFAGNLDVKSILFNSKTFVNIYGKVFKSTAQHYYNSGNFIIIKRTISP